MKCPHCDGDLSAIETRAQRHYRMLTKYADGRRSHQEIADLMNADPEFKELYLQRRTAVSVKYSVRGARAHGYDAKSMPTCYERRYDRAAMVVAWLAGETQRDIAKRLKTSAGFVSRMIRAEITRQRGTTQHIDLRKPDQRDRVRQEEAAT
jgi:hypothetical protein